MNENNRQVIGQPIKCGLLAFVLSSILVLLLALIAKMTTVSPNALPIINEVLKAVAVGTATAIACRNDKLFIKAILISVVYSLLNSVLFVALGGKLEMLTVAVDFGISFAVCLLVCIFKSRKN